MKIVLLDADTLGRDTDLGAFASLGEFISYKTTSQNEVKGRIKDADIIITNKVCLGKNELENSKVELIALTATGMNNIDLEFCAKSGIVVKNVANYSTNSVAQQCFASLLALLNHTSYYDSYCKDINGWANSEVFVHLQAKIYELANKSFCVVGFGDIGRAVAKIASAFNCNVCYYSTSGKNNNNEYKRVNFEDVLKCNIISIHAPLNEKTQNLFNKNAIQKLQNGTILANFGRGAIVDENALAREIDKREIYYCCDVLSTEPMPKNHPFLSLKHKERLLLSPHIAWASVEARKTLMGLVYENIKNFLKEKNNES